MGSEELDETCESKSKLRKNARSYRTVAHPSRTFWCSRAHTLWYSLFLSRAPQAKSDQELSRSTRMFSEFVQKECDQHDRECFK